MSKNEQHDPLGIDPQGGLAAVSPTGEELPTPQELQSLKQVREILVGPLSTELEATVRDLDQRIDRIVGDLSDTTGKRIGAVEDKLQDGLDRMNVEMGSGLEELRGSVKGLVDEMTQLSEKFRSELDRVREQVDQLMETVATKLDDECRSLRGELVDRASLSAALSEVALRLAGSDGPMHDIDPDHPDIDIDSLLDG